MSGILLLTVDLETLALSRVALPLWESGLSGWLWVDCWRPFSVNYGGVTPHRSRLDRRTPKVDWHRLRSACLASTLRRSHQNLNEYVTWVSKVCYSRALRGFAFPLAGAASGPA